MGPRVGVDGRKISSPPEFDRGPTELPGPRTLKVEEENSPEVSVLYELNSAISQRTAIVKVKIVKNSTHHPCTIFPITWHKVYEIKAN